jgi:hypothetical protein
VLGRAGQRGQARRFEQAKLGKATWLNPGDIQQFRFKDHDKKADYQKKVDEASGEAFRAATPEANVDLGDLSKPIHFGSFNNLYKDSENPNARKA